MVVLSSFILNNLPIYFQNILYTGSVDCSIRSWDIRNTKQCIHEMSGHRFAVRRVKVRG